MEWDFSQFHFLRPVWFLALIPLGLLVFALQRRRLQNSAWAQVVDPALRPYVLDDTTERKHKASLLLSLVGVIAITALAGPVWEKLPQPLFRNQSALVIALDLSRSMDATDLNPSRLTRARFKIADLVKQRRDGQTALLVYARDAYMVTPLTNDADTILSQLQALSTDLMPRQGSRADYAIARAMELLQQGGVVRGDILLVTDSVDTPRDAQAAANAVQSQAYRVHVLAMGTQAGAPIPQRDGGFLSDEFGNIVVPSMDVNSLKQVAAAGGGAMQTYQTTEQDIARLQLQFEQADERNADAVDDVDLKSDVWREAGPALLLLLIPLAAYAFRRGLIVSLMFPLVLFGLPSHEAQALDWWQRADQKAAASFESDPAAAAETFTDPDWRGAAQYRAGDYSGALESWAENTSAEGWYNRGNAHAQLGEYEEALSAYKNALQKKPDFPEAQHNYDQVKKAKEEAEKNDEQQPSDDQKQDTEDGEGEQDQQGDSSSDSDHSDQNSEQDQSGEEPSDEQQSSEQQNQSGQGEASESAEQASKPSEKEQSAESDGEKKEAEGAVGENESTHDEDAQTTDAILRVIPDDPGGLLRRKFQYQYQQRDGRIRSPQDESGEPAW